MHLLSTHCMPRLPSEQCTNTRSRDVLCWGLHEALSPCSGGAAILGHTARWASPHRKRVWREGSGPELPVALCWPECHFKWARGGACLPWLFFCALGALGSVQVSMGCWGQGLWPSDHLHRASLLWPVLTGFLRRVSLTKRLCC